MTVQFTINGTVCTKETDLSQRLSVFLRNEFSLLSVKTSCYHGECGSCIVLLDGEPISSCIVPLFAAQNSKITTVEGILNTFEFDAIEKGFDMTGVSPCGLCGASKTLLIYSLLQKKKMPEDKEINTIYSLSQCQCIGINTMRAAIKIAYQLKEQKKLGNRK